MSLVLRKNKEAKSGEPLSKADRLAIKMGGRRFDPAEAVIDPDFELEDFLRWRNERREAEQEAQKDCQL